MLVNNELVLWRVLILLKKNDEMKIDTLISIVCYSNELEVCNFIDQIEMQEESNKIAVAITINKATNIKKLEAHISNLNVQCFIYNPEENLGYLNGCLYGIRKCSEFMKYNWVVICNTDITFSQNDFFRRINNKQYAENIWGIAPSIELVDGGFQNPYIINRISRREFYIRKLFFGNIFTYSLYFWASDIKKLLLGKRNMFHPKSQEIYAPHGSCMIFRNNVMNIVCNENNNIFLYCEEEYLGGIIYENKKVVFYDESLKVIHNEHQTLGKINYLDKQKWYAQSMDFLDKRIYGKENK